MNKKKIVNQILEPHRNSKPKEKCTIFAPSDIALCKYWGKRNSELNLPLTSSLSISLGNLGSTTTLSFCERNDEIILNNNTLASNSEFVIRAKKFLDLFRPTPKTFFKVDTHNNIPTAAGLASSASGFASLVLALDDLFQYQLSTPELSILARLGSGSACRSLWQGFVEWDKGTRDDGMDSFAKPIDIIWPELCVGLLIVESGPKKISSREAMQRTVETSALYKQWPTQVEHDLALIKQAIQIKNFELLGSTAEQNAIAMHATMLDAHPAIDYSTAETLRIREQVQQCRHEGIPVYFTQDAGPNLKLLFEKKNQNKIQCIFKTTELIKPFENHIF